MSAAFAGEESRHLRVCYRGDSEQSRVALCEGAGAAEEFEGGWVNGPARIVLAVTWDLLECRGPDWDTEIDGQPGATVKELLTELYVSVGATRQWALIRYISGILKKKVEALDEVSPGHRGLALIPVLWEGATKGQINARLQKYPDCSLLRGMSYL